MSDIKNITEKVAYLTDHLVELRAPRAQKDRDSEKEELELWKAQQDIMFRPAGAPQDQRVIGPGEKKAIQVDAPEEDDDSSVSSRRSDFSDSSSSRISDVTEVDPDDWDTDMWYEKVRILFEKLQNKQEWDMMVSLRRAFDSRAAERNAGLEHIQNLDEDRRKEADRFKHAQQRFDKDMEDSQVHIFTTLNNFNTGLHTAVDSIRTAKERRQKKKKNSGYRFSFSNMRKTRKILWADDDGSGEGSPGMPPGMDMEGGEGGVDKQSAAGDLLRVISGQQNQIASLKTTAFLAEKKVTLHQNALFHLERMQGNPEDYLEAPEEIQNILLDMMMRRETTGSVSGGSTGKYMVDSDLPPAEYLYSQQSPDSKPGTKGKRQDDLQLNIEINELKRKVREVQDGLDQVVPKHKRHLTQRRTVQEEMEKVLNKGTPKAEEGAPEDRGKGSMIVARRGKAGSQLKTEGQGKQADANAQRKNSASAVATKDLPLHEQFTKLQLRINQGQLTLQRGNEERNLLYESIRKAELWRSRSMNRDSSPRQTAQGQQLAPKPEKAVSIVDPQESSKGELSEEQVKRLREREDEIEIKKDGLRLASNQKEVIEGALMKAKAEYRTVAGAYISNMGRPAPSTLDEGEVIVQDLNHQARKLRGAMKMLNNKGNEMLKACNMPAMELPEVALAPVSENREASPSSSKMLASSQTSATGKARAPGAGNADPAMDSGTQRRGRGDRALTEVEQNGVPSTPDRSGQTQPSRRGDANAGGRKRGAAGAKSEAEPASAAGAAGRGGRAAEGAGARAESRGGGRAARGMAAASEPASDNAASRSPRQAGERGTGEGASRAGRGAPSSGRAIEAGSPRHAPGRGRNASGSSSPVSRTPSPPENASRMAPGGGRAAQSQASGNSSSSRTPASKSHGGDSSAGGQASRVGGQEPRKTRTKDERQQFAASRQDSDVFDEEEDERSAVGNRSYHAEPAHDDSSATDDNNSSSSKADRHTHFDIMDGEEVPAGFVLAKDGKRGADRDQAAKLAKMKHAAKEIVKMQKGANGQEFVGGRGQEGSSGELQGPPDMISRLLGIQRENIEITEQIKVYKDMMSNAKKNGALSTADVDKLENMNKQENDEIQDEMQKELAELRLKVRRLQKKLKLMRQQWNKLEQFSIKIPQGARRPTVVDNKRPSIAVPRQQILGLPNQQPEDESGRNSSVDENNSRKGSKGEAGKAGTNSPQLHAVTLQMDPNAPPGDHASHHGQDGRKSASGHHSGNAGSHPGHSASAASHSLHDPPGLPSQAGRSDHHQGEQPSGSAAAGGDAAQAQQREARNAQQSARRPSLAMPWVAGRRGSQVTRTSVLNHLASPRATFTSVRRSLNALADASRRASDEINDTLDSMKTMEVSATAPPKPAARASVLQTGRALPNSSQNQSLMGDSKGFKRGSILPGHLLEGHLSSMFQHNQTLAEPAEGLSLIGSIAGKGLQQASNVLSKRLSARNSERAEASRHTTHTDYLDESAEAEEESRSNFFESGDLLVTNARTSAKESEERKERILKMFPPRRAQTVVLKRARTSRFGHNMAWMQRLRALQGMSRSLFVKPTDAGPGSPGAASSGAAGSGAERLRGALVRSSTFAAPPKIGSPADSNDEKQQLASR